MSWWEHEKTKNRGGAKISCNPGGLSTTSLRHVAIGKRKWNKRMSIAQREKLTTVSIKNFVVVCLWLSVSARAPTQPPQDFIHLQQHTRQYAEQQSWQRHQTPRENEPCGWWNDSPALPSSVGASFIWLKSLFQENWGVGCIKYDSGVYRRRREFWGYRSSVLIGCKQRRN